MSQEPIPTSFSSRDKHTETLLSEKQLKATHVIQEEYKSCDLSLFHAFKIVTIRSE